MDLFFLIVYTVFLIHKKLFNTNVALIGYVVL